MSIKKFIKKSFVYAVIGGMAVAMSSCTSTNPYTGQQQTSRTTIGAGVGAAGGAIVGALVGGQRGALIGAAAGGVGGAAVGSSIDRQQRELGSRLRGTGVQVRRVGNSVQLVMYSDVTFAFNSADVKRSLYPALESVASVLREYDHTNVVITGYTDNVGKATYNQGLSERRAASVGRILEHNGVSHNRVFTRGMGQRHPVASNATASGRAKNRRVVITLRPMG